MSGFPFQGASGRHYDYVLVSTENAGAIPLQAGNYILAQSTSGGPVAIYIGHADSIRNEITATTVWNTARLDYKANLIYIHPQLNKQAREAERGDLVARLHPPMNALDKAD